MDSGTGIDSDDIIRKRKLQRMKQKAVKVEVRESSNCNGGCSCSDSSNNEHSAAHYDLNKKWIIGEFDTIIGKLPQISSELTASDILGAWKARWGVGRMNYKVNPGLYAVGNPDENSQVLVTANYKLTFDTLRKELKGLNLWIMVLDTKGINVWCAAGKGTFGTKELINRISQTRLSEIVAHKTIILPQLGAPGIKAHEVTGKTGFHIKFGPVRASDIGEYLNSGLTATPKMREVRFTTKDRLVLTPMEINSAMKPSIVVFGVMFLVNLIARNKFGIIDFYSYIGALVAGCILTPILLPWIPVKPFALKGWILGLLWSAFVILINGWPFSGGIEPLRGIAYLLALPSISAYAAMNFTGSSTYTSFSGVLKEMKTAVPLILISVSLGTILLLVNAFVS